MAKQRKVQLVSTKIFGMGIKADSLYAAFAAYREEMGGRGYWLLQTKSEAKQAGKTIKVPGGTTISKNTRGLWMRSGTSPPRSRTIRDIRAISCCLP